MHLYSTKNLLTIFRKQHQHQKKHSKLIRLVILIDTYPSE